MEEDYGGNTSSMNEGTRSTPPPHQTPHTSSSYNNDDREEASKSDNNSLNSKPVRIVRINANISQVPPVTTLQDGKFVIHCKVCGYQVDVTDKREHHVVKCERCHEATPIKDAPVGQKYVRCPCNCLLICKVSSQQIACPREACRQIIRLSNDGGAYSIQSNSPYNQFNDNNRNMQSTNGMCRVTCGYCYESFLFNTQRPTLAVCPHCEKTSSVGPTYVKFYRTMFMTLSMIFFVIALAITLATVKYIHGFNWLIILLILLYLINIGTISRTVHLFNMRISMIECNNS